MKKNTSLTVVKPKALPIPAVVPKPTKSDIINAAVERARQKYEQRRDEILAQNEEVDGRIRAECLRLLSEDMSPYEVSLGYIQGKDASIQFVFDMDAPSVKKLLKEKSKIEAVGWFNEDRERGKIKDALDGTQDRVALILSKEENVKLLDDLLLKINAKKEK